MPYKVLHVLNTAQPEGAAVAHVVSTLASGLDPEKYSLYAWFLGEEGPLVAELEARGVRTRVIPWRGVRRDPLGAWRLWRALREEEFEIIHQHFGGRAVRWIILGAARGGVVVQLHQRVNEARSLRPARVWIWGVDAVIADSCAISEKVVGMRPRVVYLGVPIPPAGAECRRALRSESGRVIGTASRLVPLKGIQYIIRALALLRHEFPDLRLEIAGSGPGRAGLERVVRHLGLSDCVKFLGWRHDLVATMIGWDVFVLASLDEGFPLAVLEAMAAGLPVVATEVGGLPELVENGRTGWLVPPTDPEKLAERLRMLLLDAEQRYAMGTAGRARVRERFSTEQMAEAIEKIYEGILQSHSRR